MIALLLPLAVLPLLTRLIPHRADSEADWRWSLDLPLMLLSGLVLAGLGGVWLSAFSLLHSTVISSPDFVEYCGSVAVALDGALDEWSHNRSRLSGGPAVFFAGWLGVVDGLLVGALLGQALLGTGLYLWGRALHSRLAGVSAALLACTLLPLAVLGRTITFYPMIVGVLTLSTATAVASWRWPSVWTLALAGAGAGLAFLVDLRGLIWGLVVLGMAAVALGLDVRRPRQVLLRLLALALPVGLAWRLGPVVYLEQTVPLEVIGELAKGWKAVLGDAGVGVIHHPADAPMTAETGYIWGRSSPWRIPHTLQYLAAQSANIPAQVRDHPTALANRAAYIEPLIALVATAGLIAVAGLRHHPRRLLALAGTVLPFLVVLNTANEARFAAVRFISNGMPFAPLLMGQAWASLSVGAAPRDGDARKPTPWRPLAATGLLLVVVLGGVQTWLSPTAPWREPLRWTENSLVKVDSITRWPQCAQRVQADREAGQPVLLDLLP